MGTKQHHYLWALLSSSYEEKELYRFTLHGVLNDSKAALAFDTEEEAREWHAAFERALEGLHAAAGRAAPHDLATAETPMAARNGGPAAAGWRGHLRVRSLGRELDFAAAGGGGSGGGTRGSSPAGSATGGGSGGERGGGWFGRSNSNARDASTSTSNRGGAGGGSGSMLSRNRNSNAANAGNNDDDLLVPTPRLDSSQQLERELQQTLAAPRRPRAAPPGVSMPGSPSESNASAAFGGAGGSGRSSTNGGSDASGERPENHGGDGASNHTNNNSNNNPSSSSDPVGLRAWYTEDGVTVYVGQDADGDDVLVESFVVRAPPRLCALTLLRGEVEGSGGVGFGPDAPQLLGSVDPHTQFLRARWSPPHGFRKLLAGPRELVLKRTWRRDDDGQYVILYTSADDDEVRRSCSSSSSSFASSSVAASAAASSTSYSIFPPVEGRVLSSGYTFAPLLPEYDPARACAETLVTHVAKLDPGGFISALRRHGGLPGKALARLSWGSLLLPLAQRSIALKNKAEAERFIARPFLAGSRSATTAAAVANANNGAGASSSSLSNLAGGVPSSSSSAAVAAAAAQAIGASSPATNRLSARDAAAAERATAAAHTRSIFRRAPSPAVGGARGANATAAGTATSIAPSVARRATTKEEEDTDDDEQFDDVSEITDDGSDSEDAEEALAAAGTMPREMWSCPGAAGFKVRGPTYLEDHRKVAAGEPMLSLAAVDLLHLDAPCFDVARHLASVRRSPAPFMFVVNLMIPGATPHSVVISWAADRAAPSVGGGGGGNNGGGDDDARRSTSSRRSGSLSASSSAPNLSHLGTLARQETAPPMVAASKLGGVPSSTMTAMTSDAASRDSSSASFYHEAQGGDQHHNNHHDDDYDAPSSPFDLALARFLAGGFGGSENDAGSGSAEANARRDGTFKLIPRITEGSWIVKQSVGTTPCLLGHKLAQRYSRGPNYVEVDVDVASSSVAATVVGLVMGATKSVVVDMGIVLEGHAGDELPEALLGTVRLARVDMARGRWLDTKTGRLYAEGEKPEWAK